MNVYILGGKRREMLPQQEFFIRKNIIGVKDIYYVQGPFNITGNKHCAGYGDKFQPTNLKDIHITDDYLTWTNSKKFRMISIIEHCLQYYCDDWSLFLHADMIPIVPMSLGLLLNKKMAAGSQPISVQWFLKHPKYIDNNLELIFSSNKMNRWVTLNSAKIADCKSFCQIFAPGFFHTNNISIDKEEVHQKKVKFVQDLQTLYELDGELGMFNFIQSMFNIQVEAFRWHINKKPERSDEEIKRIFNICEDCDEFNRFTEDTGQCGVCHCPLKAYKTKTVVPIAGIPANKIQLATSQCPLKDPSWKREV